MHAHLVNDVRHLSESASLMRKHFYPIEDKNINYAHIQKKKENQILHILIEKKTSHIKYSNARETIELVMKSNPIQSKTSGIRWKSNKIPPAN